MLQCICIHLDKKVQQGIGSVEMSKKQHTIFKHLFFFRTESSSEFEDDDGDVSSEGYCIYENTNDVHYYNVSSETSDFIGEGNMFSNW